MSFENERSRVLSAFVDATAIGDTEILPAISGLRYKVVGFILTSGNLANSVYFASNTTKISCTFAMNGNKSPNVVPHADVVWFQTALGEALNINLSGAQILGVQVLYTISHK